MPKIAAAKIQPPLVCDDHAIAADQASAGSAAMARQA